MFTRRALPVIVVMMGVASAPADAQQPSGGAAATAAPTAPAPQPPPESEEPSARRKGFIIGFGAGAGMHRTPTFPVFDRFGRVVSSGGGDHVLAIATDVSIGYAPGDQLLLYYSNKVGFTTDTEVDAVGVTGFGATYMLRRTSPTFFVNGSIGVGSAGTFITSSSSESGAGYSIGGGYEFARHYSLNGDAVFVRLGGGQNHTVYRVLFNFLFY